MQCILIMLFPLPTPSLYVRDKNIPFGLVHCRLPQCLLRNASNLECMFCLQSDELMQNPGIIFKYLASSIWALSLKFLYSSSDIARKEYLA